jgi:hypothetical protein
MENVCSKCHQNVSKRQLRVFTSCNCPLCLTCVKTIRTQLFTGHEPTCDACKCVYPKSALVSRLPLTSDEKNQLNQWVKRLSRR